jgi:D-3-phosphoglycerate dehydrogenase / 2-oxoglutarate reductase
MTLKKILLIDTIHSVFESVVSSHGYKCIDGSSMSREEILQDIKDYVGIVIRSRFRIDEEFLAASSGLKFIARSGAGMENIDVDAAGRHNIFLINAPEGNRGAVGEHAVAMLLCLFNKLLIADPQVRHGIWKRSDNRGTELKGMTVAIIGFGNMGSAFAKCLSGFGVEIIAYDKYATIDKKSFPMVEQVELNDVFERADVVSLHVPLTDETKFMVNDDYLNSFKKNIYIINTARGQVVKTDALVNSIKSGNVLGACLDVMEYESTSFEEFSNDQMPEPWKYLIGSNKVVLTPHIAGWTFESYRKLSEVMANKVLKLNL